MKFKIGNKIFESFKPLIIAELSANHNQSLKTVFDLIEAAYEAKVDAIKLQTYKPWSITLDSDSKDFIINDKKSLWNKKKLYDLYFEGSMPYEWHKKVFDKANKLGLICFSTPFDVEGVNFLEKLKSPCYKIASFEINHIPLIKRISKTNKPIILSTGMSTIKEINEAVKIIKKYGCKKFALLKCASTYPANPSDCNIITIQDMIKRYKCPVGLSDHTLGIGVSVAAITLGACIIEKHLTLDRSIPGLDSKFSLEPSEFKLLVQEINNAIDAVGQIKYGPTKNEKKSSLLKRSIYVSQDIMKGEKFSKKNISVVRPGYGKHPREFENIIGKIAKRNFKSGMPLNKI